MVTQEMLQAAMQERMQDIARLQVEQQARAQQAEGPSARPGRSGLGIGRLPLPSFVMRAFRTAPAS